MTHLRLANFLALLTLTLAASGCTYVSLAAATMPPPTVEAQYKRFAGERIGVMVWADRGLRIDWPTFQLDLATSIQRKLSAQTGKKKVLAGATFPLAPASVARYQEDHPEIEFAPVEETAAKLDIGRLIYVEVEDFATRSDTAGELFRGTAKGSVKVVEVQTGKGVTAYEERNIQVAFPPKAPQEGISRGSDYMMYVGTIDLLATRICERFIPYESRE